MLEEKEQQQHHIIILHFCNMDASQCKEFRECVIGCNTNFEFLATDMVVAAIT
jgi:hypothetical protein